MVKLPIVRSSKAVWAAGPAQQLSLSLPLRPEPFTDADCRGYFANLLFEGPQLEKVLDSYKLDRGDVGALFSALDLKMSLP